MLQGDLFRIQTSNANKPHFRWECAWFKINTGQFLSCRQSVVILPQLSLQAVTLSTAPCVCRQQWMRYRNRIQHIYIHGGVFCKFYIFYIVHHEICQWFCCALINMPISSKCTDQYYLSVFRLPRDIFLRLDWTMDDISDDHHVGCYL